MTRFIKKIFLFVCYSLAAGCCFILAYSFYNGITVHDIPAPNLSNSYSYNEKMEFLHTHQLTADVVAIGSSMSLNNLSSDVITGQFHSDSYLNAASWGTSIKDDFLLLKILTDLKSIHTVIMASNIADFEAVDKKVKYQTVRTYLQSDPGNEYQAHLKTFALEYYLSNFTYAKVVRSCLNHYEYLGFDKYGAVNFDSDNFVIEAKRWTKDYFTDKILDTQYNYLDSIARFCTARNMRLLVFQSPIRQGLYTCLDQNKIDLLQHHTSKIETILTKYNQVFVNSNNAIWNDSLFIDGTHLNSKGAKRFTAYCFEKVKNRN